MGGGVWGVQTGSGNQEMHQQTMSRERQKILGLLEEVLKAEVDAEICSFWWEE